MSRLFEKEFNELWNKSYFNNSLLHDLVDNLRKPKHEHVREFVVNIKGVQTKITYRFDKDGYPVSCDHISEYIPSQEEEELNKLLLAKKEALQKEDYKQLVDLQDKINNLKKKMNQ